MTGSKITNSCDVLQFVENHSVNRWSMCSCAQFFSMCGFCSGFVCDLTLPPAVQDAQVVTLSFFSLLSFHVQLRFNVLPSTLLSSAATRQQKRTTIAINGAQFKNAMRVAPLDEPLCNVLLQLARASGVETETELECPVRQLGRCWPCSERSKATAHMSLFLLFLLGDRLTILSGN